MQKKEFSKISYLTFIVLVFVISRFVYFYLGIRFCDNSLPWYWQFIDPQLLKNNLLQSIYYLHTQPPLFNLYLGIILKLFPENSMLAFMITFQILGLLLSVTIFLLMTRLEVSPKLSTALTCFFIISPSCILYENLLLYSYPVATMLCMAALFLHRFLTDSCSKDGFAFFTFLSLIVLTRSLFHFFWLLFFVLLLLFFKRDNWKKILICSGFPVFLAFFWYTKNAIVFGSFSSSTWLGMNIARIVHNTIPIQDRELLVKQGKISNQSLYPPFERIDEYKDLLTRKETNIPILDQVMKSTGFVNLHNINYISLSKRYLKDSFVLIRQYPIRHLKNLLHSYAIYFTPANDYRFLDSNRKYIKPIEKFYNVIFYGQFVPNLAKWFIGEEKLNFYRSNYYLVERISKTGLFLLFIYFFLFFYFLKYIFNSFVKKTAYLPSTQTVIFLLINIIYVTIICTFLDLGENNRFRFLLDPYILIMAGLFFSLRFKNEGKNM